MRISVRVKPNSKKEGVEEKSEREFVLYVRAPAREGKANDAVVKLLSGYFNLPKSRISIALGLNSKNKVVDIR